VAQATMGALKQLATSEGSEAVKAAVKVAASARTVLPVARVVSDAFVGSLKNVLTTTASEAGKAAVKETGHAVVKEAGKAVVAQTSQAVVKEAGKAVAKEAGKAVAKEGAKAGATGVLASLPGIGNIINGAFALASGADFLGSLMNKDLSTGEKIGKLVKFGSSAVATLMPAGGGLVSFAGGVAGGAITGASSASRQAAAQQTAPAATPEPAPTTERDAKLEGILKDIRAPNALNPEGGTELPEGTLESPQLTSGVLNRLSTAILDGKAADPAAATALKDMATIFSSMSDAAPLSDANKKRLKTLASSVSTATDEGLKGLTLRTAQELRNPEVAKKFGKHAAEAAQGALNGLASLQRMAGKTGSASTVSTSKVQAGAATALQVLGKITHFAMEAKSSVG